MKLLEGREIADKIENQLREKISALRKKPVLAMFLVGNDPSSSIYIRKKKEACQRVGIESREILMPQEITTEDLVAEVAKLNGDDSVSGILVQLPLPGQIDEMRVLETIDQKKDVDCLNPASFGKFITCASGCERYLPITPRAIFRLLSEYNIEISGKKVVMVGYSNIVGKPTAHFLVEMGATVTICTSRTKDLGEQTKQADILITAVGKRNLITEDMVKSGVIVIDIGIVREGGKIYGDVDFDRVRDVASFITPVPGGVGPLTVAGLLERTFELFEQNIQ